MNIIYPNKGKTQGHLREIMTKDYKQCWNSVLVARKYEVTANTVLKRSKTENLENKSSAQKMKLSNNFDYKNKLIYFKSIKQIFSLFFYIKNLIIYISKFF